METDDVRRPKENPGRRQFFTGFRGYVNPKLTTSPHLLAPGIQTSPVLRKILTTSQHLGPGKVTSPVFDNKRSGKLTTSAASPRKTDDVPGGGPGKQPTSWYLGPRPRSRSGKPTSAVFFYARGFQVRRRRRFSAPPPPPGGDPGVPTSAVSPAAAAGGGRRGRAAENSRRGATWREVA